MDVEILKYIGLGFLIGITVGIFIGVHYSKKEKDKHKSLAFALAMIWVLIHIISFFLGGEQVDIIFNVIGALAVGDVIGIKVVAPIIEKVIEKISIKK